MKLKLIIAGVGGQGVVYATKVISQAALARGEQVLASENHGMSQRGGSVLAHLKIGGHEAPLVRRGTADVLIALDRAEALRNLLFVRGAGSVFVNSPNLLERVVMDRLQELKIDLFALDAAACARELGTPAATNMIILGFAAAQARIDLSVDDLKQAVKALGPARMVELNWSALEKGAAAQPQTPSLLPPV